MEKSTHLIKKAIRKVMFKTACVLCLLVGLTLFFNFPSLSLVHMGGIVILITMWVHFFSSSVPASIRMSENMNKKNKK